MESVNRKHVAVLVHGLGAHRLMMALMGYRLKQLGYRVVNWGYSSIRGTIERHGQALHKRLSELDLDETTDELFLVTHSMGGIVGRTALSFGMPEKLQRMVMLAPPNRGSGWATWFGPLLRPFCHTVDQLATRPDSYVNLLALPPAHLEIGVIAAGQDVLVPIEHTRLGCERDHMVWPNTLHSGVLFRQAVVDQIHHFLKNGIFLREERPLLSA